MNRRCKEIDFNFEFLILDKNHMDENHTDQLQLCELQTTYNNSRINFLDIFS